MQKTFKNSNAQATIEYYNRRESRFGYQLVVHGTKHYGYYPEGTKLTMRQAQRVMETMLGARIGKRRGARVLDAGCGEGYVATHLAQDFGYEVHGIDLLDWSIAKANENKKRAGVDNLVFALGDYSNTGYPDNYFDAIYTMETLVHSPDYNQTLQEFYRMLKPGGKLINQEYAFMDKMPSEDEKTWRFMFDDCPMPTFVDFRESRLPSLWQQAGFTEVTVENATPHIIPFMRRFYQLAYIPFNLCRLLGNEKRFVNMYAAVRSYQLRDQLRYSIVQSQKPQ